MRCVVCQGRRKVDSMGGMLKDCPACDGTGLIDVKIPNETKENEDLFPNIKEHKKEKKRD